MFRITLAVVLGLCAMGVAVSTAQEKKDEKKTLEGTLTCTKCALGETKACGHALIVKEGDKKINYYLVDKGGKESYHKACCTADVDGVKVANPYRTKVAPGKFLHELRAEGENLETRSMSNVQFDRDRSFEIALLPKKPALGGPLPRDASADAQ